MLKPSEPKKVPIACGSPGFQMKAANPMRASMRPMVTTSWATSGAAASRRIRSRSIPAPNSGAAMTTVTANARSVWSPRLTFSSQ